MSNWNKVCLVLIGAGLFGIVTVCTIHDATRPEQACGDFRTTDRQVIRLCGEKVR